MPGWTRAQACFLCFQVAYLEVLGYTKEETAKKIQTPDHPAGCSKRTVFNHLRDHQGEFRPIQDWMNLYKREKGVTVHELTRQNVKQEMETGLGEALACVKRAILDGDADKAVWLIEQFTGKASQHTSVTGAVLHGHAIFNSKPVRELVMQENDMVNSAKLLKMLPGEVIEAEVVQ